MALNPDRRACAPKGLENLAQGFNRVSSLGTLKKVARLEGEKGCKTNFASIVAGGSWDAVANYPFVS